MIKKQRSYGGINLSGCQGNLWWIQEVSNDDTYGIQNYIDLPNFPVKFTTQGETATWKTSKDRFREKETETSHRCEMAKVQDQHRLRVRSLERFKRTTGAEIQFGDGKTASGQVRFCTWDFLLYKIFLPHEFSSTYYLQVV